MAVKTKCRAAWSVVGPFVISLRPDRACWHCEDPLPPDPSAVVVVIQSRRKLTSILLTCSPECERKVAEEATRLGEHPLIATSSEVSVLLRTRRGFLGVVEGWDGPDNRPYLLVHSGASAAIKLAEISARKHGDD